MGSTSSPMLESSRGTGETARSAGGEIARLLGAFETTEPLASRYDELAEAGGAFGPVERERLADETVATLEAQGQSVALALGAWTQLGRIAGDGTFTKVDDVRELRGRVESGGFPPGVGRTLDEIEATLTTGARESRDLERLRRLLDDLIDMM